MATVRSTVWSLFSPCAAWAGWAAAAAGAALGAADMVLNVLVMWWRSELDEMAKKRSPGWSVARAGRSGVDRGRTDNLAANHVVAGAFLQGHGGGPDRE